MPELSIRASTLQPSPFLLAQVATSMGVPKAALPILEELFADQDSLGATPRRITNWLIESGIGPGSRVLDLGCGKGSVALSIARRCRAHVRGIDAFLPFIAHATRQAKDLNRSPRQAPRCEFVVGDLWAEQSPRGRRYDAVVMLNIASTTDALPLLRRLVKPAGLCVLDDAVDVSRIENLEPHGLPSIRDVRHEFRRASFEILREHIFTPAQVRASAAAVTQALSRRVRGIRARQTTMGKVAQTCLDHHRAAAATLTGSIRPVVWMLRRANRAS